MRGRVVEGAAAFFGLFCGRWVMRREREAGGAVLWEVGDEKRKGGGRAARPRNGARSLP
jgi:hypothetical protein